MQIKNTRDKTNTKLSYLIFGKSKTGKTRLTTTLPADQTFLINVENNLASISGASVNYADANTWQDFMEILLWLEGLPESEMPKWIVIDSITELAKVLLQLEMSLTNHGQKAYGEINQKIPDIIRRLKSLPCNLVCLAQQGYVKDENEGNMFFSAMMAGKTLEQSLPYMFDAVLATRFIKGQEESWYTLQCKPENQYDSIGVRTAYGMGADTLATHEQQDLLALHNKIIGHSAQ